ncbi:MAG TPA: family 16 glycoside hydrolase, partial [Lacipirellulaceae bacterium]|nr:family 16 glycoside hydrolase [Lacipirellulaceae bacterium]
MQFLIPGLLPLALQAPVAGADRASLHAEQNDAISPKDHVIRLFDGKTLGDCYTWLKDTKRNDPRHVFTVSNGMIHISGDGLGGLVTNKRYRDYHLVLEFKFGERTWQNRKNAARDSGCLIHSNGIDGGYEGCWMPSIEV